MNDCRAVVVGVYRSSQTFMTMPVDLHAIQPGGLLCARRSAADAVRAGQVQARRILSRASPDASRIRPGCRPSRSEGFMNLTMKYYLEHTGIPINFGTTVLLAFFVGCAIAGQTFYLFTVENLKQFGTFKAMGMSDRRLVRMILMQALLVGGIGYGLGVGLATIYGIIAQRTMPLLAFFLPWQVRRRDRRGRAVDLAGQQPAEHPPCSRAGAGHRLPRWSMTTDALVGHGVTCRNLIKDYGTGDARVPRPARGRS